MAITGQRSITVQYSGDIVATESFPAATNAASPGVIEVKQLASGNNTITPPTSGVTAKSVTIIPPAGNLLAIILKGVAGDTGVSLHLTDPTTIGLGSASATFVLNAANTIDGVRFVWV